MCCFNPSQHAALFAAMPFQKRDLDNLAHSGVRRVLMPLDIAWVEKEWLADKVPVHVWYLLRIDEHNYQSDQAIGLAVARLKYLTSILPVHGAQLGNEWQHDLNLTTQVWRGKPPEWGIEPKDGQPGRVWQHRYWFERLVTRLEQELPSLKRIAGGWAHTQITESDPDEPGRDKHVEILAGVYGRCHAGSLHVYEFAWPGMAGGSLVDERRFRKTLDRELARLEKMGLHDVYLDEANVVKGSDVDQMRACIGMMEVIRTTPEYASRIQWFSQFTATGSPGSPPAWSPQFLVVDPEAYKLLGAYVGA